MSGRGHKGGVSQYAPRYDITRLLRMALLRLPTQKAVARAIGVNAVSVCRWARGATVPSYDSISRLAKLVGREPNEFLLDDDDDPAMGVGRARARDSARV